MDKERSFHKFFTGVIKRIFKDPIIRWIRIVGWIWKKSSHKLVEITTIIQNDNVKASAPAVYLVGQTSDNQSSVFNRGKKLWEKGLVASILINDGETKHGYPGFELWRQELVRMGVNDEAIIPLRAEIINKGVNTFTEAQALVRYAKSRGWKYIYIVAAPFHQLRAFISVVSVLLREYPSLRIYNAVGTHLDWFEEARHSQGTLKGRRIKLIKTELKRIYKYHLKGDLVSPEEVLAYLEWRDTKTKKEII